MLIPAVLQTKITPPPVSPRTHNRPRVTQALLEALRYRLTLLQAGAGYGKSTALNVLAAHHSPLIWYQVGEEDNDPLIFLLHLCYATRRALPEIEKLPIAFVEAWEGTRGPLPSASVLDQYLNALSRGLVEPTLVVLDDAHLLASPEIAKILDRLIGLAPADLHLLLAARAPLQLPNLYRWRAKGEVLTLDQAMLAFTAEEIDNLFTQKYGYELTGEEEQALYTATEGWAIALQLIWQSLRSGASSSVGDALTHQATSLEDLFDILAKEVLGVQPEDVRAFLRISATLREMTPAACDALRATQDSAAMLAYLRRQDLFLVDQNESGEAAAKSMRYRYHHIFHSFLLQQAPPEQRREWDLRAARYFITQENPDEAIFHLLRAGDTAGAANLLEQYGNQLLSIGRLGTLAAYLDALPADALHQHPGLLSQLGDLARLQSRFEEALGWYQQAEGLWREMGQREGVARALRGQARVYLDTVNPNQAESLLLQSIRLTDGIEQRESQARLYELLAENKLNAGKVEDAERLHQQALALRIEGPSESQLMYRALLRTGRLDEARQQLEARAAQERQQPVQTPRAHRETLLLLSLLYAFQGQAADSYRNALEGTQRGIELNAPYVTAVGYMRQGHALMLLPQRAGVHPLASQLVTEQYAQARQQFEKSIELSRTLDVPRLRVEAYWGLCRAYGYQGELDQALQAAQAGIEIANQAGDEWVASLVRQTIGASLTQAARYEAAEEWLRLASLGFRECSDPFSLSATRLWMCVGWYRQEDHERLAQAFPEVLATCRQHGYDYLFTRPTLLGLPDERMLVPLLILARDQGWEGQYVRDLLATLGLAKIAIHPGYQLRVVTLGTFQTWLGIHPIPSQGWRRAKARQLFQILLTYREAPLDREQILEFLWPEMDAASAQRNFKVALNTLNRVLEPERTAGSESAFILREGTTYALRPGADLWLDAQTFTETIHQAEIVLERDPVQGMRMLETALDLYQGDYLPDARYETWAVAEQEHLAALFLRTADRLANLLIQHQRYEDTIDICQRILAFDNCWERAYRHLMVAYDYLGDHGQVARTYQRCVNTLQQELDLSPTPETNELYQNLTAKSAG
jgi:LuxR family maltose regulon positive regulatory protein